MKIHNQQIMIAIKAISPYERNARTHSDKQISQICESIKEFGFTNPLLIDEQNNLIAEHERVGGWRKGIKSNPELPQRVPHLV